jgi:hypothetical protein
MGEQLSDEMGAPGYPPGDRTTEQAQQGDDERDDDAQGDQEPTSDAMDASGAMLDTEMGGGEGDLDSANEDLVRRRAYEISQGPNAGSAEENWARAEREVRTEQASP